MDLSTYEMFVAHPAVQARFIFQAKFDDKNPDHRRIVAKFATVADRYYKDLAELGFELSRCNFNIEAAKATGVKRPNVTSGNTDAAPEKQRPQNGI